MLLLPFFSLFFLNNCKIFRGKLCIDYELQKWTRLKMLFSLKTTSKADNSDKEWWLKLKGFKIKDWQLTAGNLELLKNMGNCTDDYVLTTTDDYWYLLTTTNNYWCLLTTTNDYWKLLTTNGKKLMITDYNWWPLKTE